jgi:hypothetical protein
MLNRVFYESRAISRFGPITLLGLQKKCVQRNLQDDVTSFLFSDQKRIFQVIEGPEKAVDDTMARIAANRLHDTLKIRAIMRGTERRFKHWPFGATSSDDPDFKRVMNAGQMKDFFALDVLQAEKVLGIISSRKRRAVKIDEYSLKLRNFSRHRPPRGFFSVPEKAASEKTGRVFFQNTKAKRAVAGA